MLLFSPGPATPEINQELLLTAILSSHRSRIIRNFRKPTNTFAIMDRRYFVKTSLIIGTGLTTPLGFGKAVSLFSNATDITELSALQLSQAIKSKQVSCLEVMQAYLKHIHRLNPVYNAIVGMADDGMLFEKAKKADEALARGEYWGWMHGFPHAMKDLTAVKGLPFTLGSPIYKNRVAIQDSYIARLVRNEGAIFIGKTNTPEFGLGSQCYNQVYGTTGCAYNPELTSGGSSGGAACGLATHMLPVADGGDMMGSLRNPGAFNNVIGFRPSAVSFQDTDDRPLSTLGPMGRNTADAIQLLQTIDPSFKGHQYAPTNLKGIKLGWLGSLDNYLAMEPGIINLCEGSLKTLEGQGVTVEAVKPEISPEDLWFSWTTLRHNSRQDMLDYYETPELKVQLKPELIWEIEQYLQIDEKKYIRADQIRKKWYAELDKLFGTYDFLVLPSSQVFPFSKEKHWPEVINERIMDTYHRWMEVTVMASLGGNPVINLPVGFHEDGQPMGMQIIGPYKEDKKVLEFALAYEATSDFLAKRPVTR